METYGNEKHYFAGGCGGYTKTFKKITLHKGERIEVKVGSGGVPTNNRSQFGGSTSFGSMSASGGSTLHGGSGGGGGGWRSSVGSGGTDGADGSNGRDSSLDIVTYGGKGQGTTTREFGEAGAALYSGGGGGGIIVGYIGNPPSSIDSGAGGAGTPVLATGGYQEIGDGYIKRIGRPGGGYGGGGGGTTEPIGNSFGSHVGRGAQGIVIIRDARN